MGFFETMQQIFRPQKRRKKDEDEQSRPTQDPAIAEAEQESEEFEQLRRERQETARLQQEAREKEQTALDAKIDQMLSDNPEEFLQNTVQPGGE